MANLAKFEEEVILEYFVQSNVITKEQIDKVAKNIEKNINENIYYIDQKEYAINEVVNSNVNKIELPYLSKAPPKFLSTDWLPIGSSNILVFSSKNFKQLTQINWDEEKDKIGIKIQNNKTLFSILNKQLYYNIFIDNLIYDFIPLKKLKSLPLDFSINLDTNNMYISDRAGGYVYILNLETKRILANLFIRKPGSKKTLNLVSFKDKSKLIITDNTSPSLFIVNLKNYNIKKHPLPFGILTNIKISNDNLWLYVISVKKSGKAELLILDSINFILKTSIPLKGKVFSALDDPTDIMVLSADNNWLFVMTYTDNPALFTPLINIIDLNSNSLKDLIVLDEDNKPSIIAFGEPINQENNNTSILNELVKLNLVTLEQIENAKVKLVSDLQEPTQKNKEPSISKVSFLENQELDPAFLLQFSYEELVKWEFVPLVKKDNFCKLVIVNSNNMDLEKFISERLKDCELEFIPVSKEDFKYFIDKMYPIIKEKYLNILRLNVPKYEDNNETNNQKELNNELNKTKETTESIKEVIPVNNNEINQKEQSNITKKTLKDFPIELIEKEVIAYCLIEFINIWGIKDIEQNFLNVNDIKNAVYKAIKELFEFDYTLINIPNMYKNYSLETVLSRETLLTMLTDATKNTVYEPEKKDTQQVSLIKKEENLEIKPKEVIPYKKTETKSNIESKDTVTIASPNYLQYLPIGHFLITDFMNKRVIELDPSLEIVWEYKQDNFYPQDAFRTSNGTTLITCINDDRIIEVNKQGKILWELNNRACLQELSLNRPVKALKLINGHILIVDQGHHRVFEVNALGKIVWQYGIFNSVGITEGRLYNPSDVQKLNNKHTLIVDTDNHRVIELDNKDKIVWQYGNIENRLGSGYGSNKNELNSPLQAIRLDNNNTIIVDSGNYRLIEVDIDKNITWAFYTKQDNRIIDFVPLKIFLRPPDNIIVLGEQLCIELSKKTKEIIYIKYYEALLYSKSFIVSTTNNSKLQKFSKDISSHIDKLAKETAKEYIKKAELDYIEVPLVNKYNNKIFIVNRAKQVLWRLYEVEEDNPLRLERPQNCEILPNDYLLITDTDRHRVIKVYRPVKEIVWQYGITGAIGSGYNQLGHPRSAVLTPNDTILISDQYNSRVIEVTIDKEIIWSFGGWEEGISPINAPYYAFYTKNNTILITDWSNHTVIEVNKETKEIVWQYGVCKESGTDINHLMYPEKAIKLDNNNVLICDTRNNRVLEIKEDYSIQNIFSEQYIKELKLNSPISAFKTPNQNTVIVHNNGKSIVEISTDNKVVWKYDLHIKN